MSCREADRILKNQTDLSLNSGLTLPIFENDFFFLILMFFCFWEMIVKAHASKSC